MCIRDRYLTAIDIHVQLSSERTAARHPHLIGGPVPIGAFTNEIKRCSHSNLVVVRAVRTCARIATLRRCWGVRSLRSAFKGFEIVLGDFNPIVRFTNLWRT